MQVSPLRIIQISDIHLFSDPSRDLLGVKTEESFQVLMEFVRLEKPDLILLTGDLSQDGSDDSYIRVADAVNTFGVPVYCIPGNHDDAENMRKIYPRQHVVNGRHILFENWQLILLNSQKPNAVEGYLDQSELDFLQNCLSSHPDHQTLIALHHHPVFVGCAWLDKLGLTNSEQFWSIIDQHPCVNMVLFGHVHQVHEGERKGVRYYSAPSTCIQFKTNSAAFAIEKLSPGYRWIELYANGDIKTQVERTPEYVGVFQSEAKGY